MVPLLIGTFLLEQKEYNEDATNEEVEALRSRVRVVEPGIITYKELKYMSEFSVNLMFDELDKLIEKETEVSVLLDLSAANAPSFKIRQLLYDRFDKVSSKVRIFSFTTGKNGLMNIALKFFMNTTKAPIENSVFSKDYDQALRKIHDIHGK